MKNDRQSRSAPVSPGPPPALTRPHPLDWPANAGAVEDVLTELKDRLKRKRRRQIRRVAGAVAALLIIGWVGQDFIRDRAASRPTSVASSVVWLPQRQTLADGSLVELRNGASIAVDFSGAFRRVTLEQGEAHFEVAKNPDRPFVVTAGGVEFRAVGTAFAVHLADHEVEMFVTEGRVAVEDPRVADAVAANAPAADQPGRLATVDAGTHVVVDVSAGQLVAPTVTAISKTELSKRLAWRAPKLEFSGTPLATAIEMINEHSTDPQKVRIQLGDPSLAGLRISGILRADNLDTLLAVLESDYGITADKRATEIVLHRDASGRRTD